MIVEQSRFAGLPPCFRAGLLRGRPGSRGSAQLTVSWEQGRTFLLDSPWVRGI